MKIAIFNPYFYLQDRNYDIHGYRHIFLEYHSEFILLNDPVLWIKLKILFKKNKVRKKIKFFMHYFACKDVILINFNGFPGANSRLLFLRETVRNYQYTVPGIFKGVYLYHLMDFMVDTSKLSKSINSNPPKHFLGYNDHYKHSALFKLYYGQLSKFNIPIYPLYFGYSRRFVLKKPFFERESKILVIGKTTFINSPINKYMHPIREAIYTERVISKNVVKFEENENYNIVDQFNNYQFFLNDESIFSFPPAKTFEGIACGSIMIGSNSLLYRELGFIDGINCILFDYLDFDEMFRKVQHYINNPILLDTLHKNSLSLSLNYSHDKIVQGLYKFIEEEKFLIWRFYIE